MSAPTIEHITLTAPDISCGHCVATVQGAVGELAGVSQVVASADTKQVEIEFDPAVTTLEQISDTLKEAGYPASA